MNIVTELALISGVCLAGVAIAEMLPFTGLQIPSE
jgi:hypothetical protein